MPRIHIVALLPDRDGRGWHAVTTHRQAHHCSIKGCGEPSIAYHRTDFFGTGAQVWQCKHRCADHLPVGMHVLGNRVWAGRAETISESA